MTQRIKPQGEDIEGIEKEEEKKKDILPKTSFPTLKVLTSNTSKRNLQHNLSTLLRSFRLLFQRMASA
jgi:hypothetical protein